MRNTIFLPNLHRIRITNYSLYNQEIDYTFINGVNLIVGGNGVGKTTFINIIKYALIGLYKKDLDVRVYKGEKKLIRGRYRNSNTYFRNRTNDWPTDRSGAVELWFSINDTEIYVKRSLYEVKLLEATYKKGGKVFPVTGMVLNQDSYLGYEYYEKKNETCLQYNYEKLVSEKTNLTDFEDFIFFVNQILFFGESRENVLWSESAQERLLSSFLNDANLEKKRKALLLDAKYQDSIARHKQEEIKAVRRVLNQVDSKNINSNDATDIRMTIESLESQLSSIQYDRISYQKKIDILYKELSELMSEINDIEREKSLFENKLRNKNRPGINPKYDVYKRQLFSNHICPFCNSSIEGSDIKEDVTRCFFCKSKIAFDAEENESFAVIAGRLRDLETVKHEKERMILNYEDELKKFDNDFIAKKMELFNSRKELRDSELSNSNSNKFHKEISYLAMERQIEELSMQKEEAINKSKEYQNESKKLRP